MLTTEHWQAGTAIINKLKENGYEAVFVGGAVRDFLRQKEANDIDIASSALPEQVKKYSNGRSMSDLPMELSLFSKVIFPLKSQHLGATGNMQITEDQRM